MGGVLFVLCGRVFINTIFFSKPLIIFCTCSLMQTFNGLFVLPIYCRPQLHSRAYTAPSVLQQMKSLISYVLPVLVDVNLKFFSQGLLVLVQAKQYLHGQKPLPVKNVYPIDGGSGMFLTILSLNVGALLYKVWDLRKERFQMCIGQQNVPMLFNYFLNIFILCIVV